MWRIPAAPCCSLHLLALLYWSKGLALPPRETVWHHRRPELECFCRFCHGFDSSTAQSESHIARGDLTISMRLLGQCGRTVFTVLQLRGRRRKVTKLFLIVLLSAALFAFGPSGVCMLNSRLCIEGEDEALQKNQEVFENIGDYEIKLNPGPLRIINGIHNGPSLDDNRDSSLKHPFQKAGHSDDGEPAQLQPPPQENDLGQVDGANVPVSDGQDTVKSNPLEADQFPADRSPAVENQDRISDEKNLAGIDPPGDSNPFKATLPSESESPEDAENRKREAAEPTGASNSEEKVNSEARTEPSTERKQAPVAQEKTQAPAEKKQIVVAQTQSDVSRPKKQSDEAVGDSLPGQADGRDIALDQANQKVGNQGNQPLVMSKKKPVSVNMGAVAAETVPQVANSDGVAMKPKVEQKTVPPEPKVKAQPSLQPGVVAVPKVRKVVSASNSNGNDAKMNAAAELTANTQRNNVGAGAAVMPVSKDKYVPNGAGGEVAGGGGGGGGGGAGGEAAGGEAAGGGGGGDAVDKDHHMSAGEMARAIESGEMCKSVCPPFVWSDWSPCSKACGKGRRYRKALYKFICQSSELCPLNRIEESVCEIPCVFDLEKYGGPNGLDMYPINPLNPAMYPEDKKYMCGHWLVEYEKLHNDILSGKRPPRYLVYSTGKGTYPTAGGISARLRGMTTVFFLAVLLDRAFMIEWSDPPGFDQYLEPKSFNWADLSKIEGLKRGQVRDIGSWRSAKESGISSQWYMSTNFSTYFTNELEVVQGHRYDFTYAVLRNPELMPKAFELGVDRIKCRICCAFHMLFRMTEKFQVQMDTLLTNLGAPGKSIGAIQLRTKSHNVQESVKYVDGFVRCATKAAKSLKMSSLLSWVPIFNNRLVVHIVHKKYGDKLKIPINIDTATRTVHTHLGNLPADTELEVAKAVQERTFKEFFLTMNSTIIIRKKGYEGSFGNIADAIRRFYHALGTVHTFLVGNTCTKFPDTYKIE